MDVLHVLPADSKPATSTPKKSHSEKSPVLILNDADSTLDSIFPDRDFDEKDNDSDSDSMCDENEPRKIGKGGKVQSVARRNERERNRVKHINRTFTILRQHLPAKKANKKLSKVDTLRSAVTYIRQLQGMIDDHDTMAQTHYNLEQAYMAQNQPTFPNILPGQRIPQHIQHPYMHHIVPQIQIHSQQQMYNIIDPLSAVTTPPSPVAKVDTRIRGQSVSSSVYSAPSPVSPTSSVFSAASPSYSSDSSWEALAPEEADELVDFTRRAILEITELGGW
jgi:hypothetical protein